MYERPAVIRFKPADIDLTNEKIAEKIVEDPPFVQFTHAIHHATPPSVPPSAKKRAEAERLRADHVRRITKARRQLRDRRAQRARNARLQGSSMSSQPIGVSAAINPSSQPLSTHYLRL